jgi:hypothetical protein
MLHACALAAAARLPHKVTMRALSTQSSFSVPGNLRTCLTVASLIWRRPWVRYPIQLRRSFGIPSNAVF